MGIDKKLVERYKRNEAIFEKVSKKTGVNKDFLAKIATIESDFNPKATGGGKSTAKGIFQIRPLDWLSKIFAGENNEQATWWLASRIKENRDNKFFQKKCNIKSPTEVEEYIVHFLGESDAKALLKNPNIPVDKLNKHFKNAVIPANKEVFYFNGKNGKIRTGKQVKEFYENKFKNATDRLGIKNSKKSCDLKCQYSMLSKQSKENAKKIKETQKNIFNLKIQKISNFIFLKKDNTKSKITNLESQLKNLKAENKKIDNKKQNLKL